MKYLLKKNKSNKGFSLVELLAVVTILGILLTVTIVVYSSYKKKAQHNYYVKQEDLVTQAGRDFFVDNRGKLPQAAGEESCVTLNALVQNNYIKDVQDYNKKTCNNNTSKVCAVMIAKNKYIYHSILDCGKEYETKVSTPPTIIMTPSEGTNIGPSAPPTTVEMKIKYDSSVDEEEKSPITSYRYVIYKIDSELQTYYDSGWKQVKGEKTELSISIPITASGNYYVVGSAYNKQGKLTEVKSGTISLTKDLDCNTDILFDYGAYDNKWTNHDVTISITGTGGVTGYDVELVNKNTSSVVNRESSLPTTKQYTLTTEGVYFYRVTAHDSSGNTCTKESKEIKIDKQRPECVVTSNHSGWTKDDVTLTATCRETDDTGSGCKQDTIEATFNQDTNITYQMQNVVDNAGNVANCNTVEIKIDKKSPTCEITTSINPNGNDNWYKSDVNIMLTKGNRKDPNGEIVGYDLTTSSTPSYSETNSTEDKTIKLDYDTTGITYYGYVKDAAGNTGECSKTVKRDATPPVCTLSTDKAADGENGWYKSNVKLSLDTTGNIDSTSGVVGYDLSTNQSVSTYRSLTDTTHNSLTINSDISQTKYYGHLKDAAGNTSNCEITIKRDATPPTCELTTSKAVDGNNGWYKSNVDITLTPAKRKDTTSGVTSYDLTTSSTPTYNHDNTTSNLTKQADSDTTGTTYYGYVKDEAGNTASCSKTIKLDKTPPTCELTRSKVADGDNDWYKSDVDISLNADKRIDQTSGIVGYSLTTATAVTYTDTNPNTDKKLSHTAETTGTTYYGYLVDEAGNTGSCNTTIKKDSVNPTCTVTTSKNPDGDNGWYKSNVDVKLKASDRVDATSKIESYDLTTDSNASYNETNATNDKSITVNTDTASTIYYGYVKDNAGNIGTCNKTIKRDTTAPTCSITTSVAPDDEGWYYENVDLFLTAANRKDTTSGIVGYDLTKSATASYSETNATLDKQLTQTADTESTMYYGYVKDAAGNTGNCNKEIKKISSVPTCSITVSKNPDGENGWYKSNVEVKLEASNRRTPGGTIVGYDFTTSPVATYTQTDNSADKVFTQSEDTEGVTYYGYVKNSYGKVGSCSYTIKKDSVAPTCAITKSKDADGDNGWYKSDVTVSYNASDRNDTTSGIVGYDFSTSNTATYSETSTVANKSYTVSSDTTGVTYYAHIKDFAGNANSCQVTIKKDSTAPTCEVTTNKNPDGSNNWYKSNVTVSLTSANRKDTTSGIAGYDFTTSSTATYTKTDTNNQSVTHSAETTGTTYYGYVKDKAGNIGDCSKTIKKDSVAPTCTITKSKNPDGDNSWYKSNVTTYLKAVDRVDVTSGIVGYNLTTTGAASYTQTSTTADKSLTQSAETTGTTYYGYVKDAAGNTGSCSETIKKDSVAPTCTVTTSKNPDGEHDWYKSNVTTYLKAADRVDATSGIASYDFTTSNTATYTQTSETTDKQLTQNSDTTGTTYYGYVKDKAGNIGSCDKIIKRDTVNPTCEITTSIQPNEEGWYSSNVDLNLTPEKRIDVTSGVTSYDLTANPAPTYTHTNVNDTQTVTHTDDTTGITYYGYVKDDAGNTGSCNKLIKKDSTGPACTLTVSKNPDGDNGWYKSNVTVKLEPANRTSPTGSITSYDLTTSATPSYTETSDSLTKSIEHTIDTKGTTYYGYVKNSAGKTGSCSITIKKDTVDPTCTVTASKAADGDNGWYKSEVTVYLKAADRKDTTSGVIGYKFTTSTTPTYTDTSTTSNKSSKVSADTSGTTYRGYVKDAAGNTGSCNLTIKRDTVAPTCEVITSKTVDGDNGWYKSDVDVILSSADRKDERSGIAGYNLTDSTTPSYSETSATLDKSITINTDTQEKTYYGYIKDKAGNTGDCSVSVKRDATPPQCSLTTSKAADGDNGWYKTSVSVYSKVQNRTDATSGIAGYNFNTNTTPSYTRTDTDDQTLTQSNDTAGTTYYGYIKDNAGNTNNCSVTIKKDSSAPTCEITTNKEPDGEHDWYKSSVTLSLTSANRKDTTSGVASYDFTTSNSPTYTQTDKTANKSLSQSTDTSGTTYYGYVKDAAGNTGSCNKAIKRDTVAPTCTLTKSKAADGDDGWYKSDVTINLTAANRKDTTSGVASYNLTTGAASYIETNTTATKSLTQSDDTAETTYYGYVKDAAGNTGNCSMPIKKDSTPPNCSVTASKNPDGSNSWYKSNVTMYLKAANRTDNVSGVVSYGFIDSDSTTYTDTDTTTDKSLALKTDTTGKTYYGYVKDAAGNENSCSKTVKRDATPPTCTITTNPEADANGWHGVDVDVSLTAANRKDTTSKVASYDLTTSSTASYSKTNTTATVTLQQTEDTDSTMYYGYVKDNAGNTNSCSKEIKKTSVLPSCTLTVSKAADGDNGWYKSNVTVSLTAANRTPGSGTIVGYDLTTSETPSYSKTSTTATATLDHTAESSGTTYYGYVKNSFGQVGSCSITIKKDSIAPTCTVTTSANPTGSNNWYLQSVDVKLAPANRNDERSGVASYDLTTSSTASYSQTSLTATKTLTQSSATSSTIYHGYVKDGAGNTGTCTKEIKLDPDNPTCTITVSKNPDGDNSWYKSNVTVYMKAANRKDTTSGVTSYDFTTSSSPSYTQTSTTTDKSVAVKTDTSGTTYYGYVKDASGRTGSCSKTIKRDATPPQCSLTRSKNPDGDNNWYKTSVDVNLTAANRTDATSGVASYDLTTSGAATYTKTSTTASASLTQSADTAGTVYHGYVKDAAGNVNSCETTIYKDSVAPTCTLTLNPASADGSNGYYKSPVTISLTSGNRVDATSLINSYDLTDSSNATYTKTDSSATASLTHNTNTTLTTYYGYVKDNAGNIGSCSAPIKYQSTTPKCTLTVSKEADGENGWYKSNVDVKLEASNREAYNGNTIVGYNLTTSKTASYTETSPTATKKLTHSAESTGTTYYGYVKDSAGSTGSCQITIKKDSVAPTCTVTASADPTGPDSWYKENVTMYLKAADRKDTTSGVIGYKFTTSTTPAYTDTSTTADKSSVLNTDTSGTTYYGYVKDAAGNTGSCNKKVKRDATPPQCTITVSKNPDGENDWYKSNVTVYLKAADRVDATSGVKGYSFTTSTTKSYSETSPTAEKSASISTDTTGVTYHGYIKDNADNINECTKTIKRDTVAPTCTLTTSTAANSAGWWTANVDVKLTAANRKDTTSGVKSYDLTKSPTATYTQTSPTANKSLTQSDDTAGQMYYGYVKDDAGNTGSCSINIQKDSQAPTCTITRSKTADGDNGWYKSSVDMYLTAANRKDNLGVTSYDFTTSSSATYTQTSTTANKTLSQTTDTASTGQGYHGYVKDAAGNTGSCTDTIYVDQTPPACAITFDKSADGDNGWYKSNVEVRLTQANRVDSGSGVAGYNLTTSTTASYTQTAATGTYTQNQTADTTGTTWRCYIKDKAGNIGSNTRSLKKDSTPPTCTITRSKTADGNNGWYKSSVDMYLTAANRKDTTSGVASYDFTTSSSATYTQTSTTANKTLTQSSDTASTGQGYHGYVKDAAGNTGSCTDTIYVDQTPPACAITFDKSADGDNGWYKSNIEVRLTQANRVDSGSGVAGYNLTTSTTASYTQTAATGTYSVSHTTDTTGTTYRCYIKDKAGNVGSNTRSLKKDSTAPTCAITFDKSPDGDNDWYKSNVEVRLTQANRVDATSGVAGYNLTTSTSASYTQTATTGTYTQNQTSDTTGTTWRCYIKDAAGNTGSNTRSLKKDSIAPTLAVTGKRCLVFPSDGGASSGTSSGNGSIVDSNGCVTLKAKANNNDKYDSIQFTDWNKAGATFTYTVTETNFKNILLGQNNTNASNTSSGIGITTQNTSTSKTGTQTLSGQGLRHGLMVAFDEAGNYSEVDNYVKISKDYTATFKLNLSGVSWTSAMCNGTYNSTSKTCTKTVTYGYTYGSLPHPTATGYKFEGWYTSASGGTQVTWDTMFEETANVTLYAHWQSASLTCAPSSAIWSNSSSGIIIAATTPSTFKFTAYPTSNDSSGNVIIDSTNGKRWTTATTTGTKTGMKYYHFVYGKNSASSLTSHCYSRYDNLKPYTPVVYAFKPDPSQVGSTFVTDNCTETWSTSAKSCTATITTYGRTDFLIWWSRSVKDQSSTNASGVSGNKTMKEVKTYKDGTTCTTITDIANNWTVTSGANCSIKFIKDVITVTDSAGNTSAALTINFNWIQK